MVHALACAPFLKKKVERLADGGSEDATSSDRSWLPVSDEAYFEFELDEAQAPVGLVVRLYSTKQCTHAHHRSEALGTGTCGLL